MSYFKFTTSEALAAWDDMWQKDAALRKAGQSFAKLFGGRAVFNNDITRTSFYGIVFDDQIYASPTLWTAGKENTRYARWPKAKAPRGMAGEHRALTELWNGQYPKDVVDRCGFYRALGLDWGMLFLTGCQWFHQQGAIFIETGATPTPGSGAIEILGSEYKAARKASEEGGT